MLFRSKATIEQIAGQPVIGYRAPNYSIVRETMWAMDILAEEGFRYDSSIFPIRHDRYGIPDFPRSPVPVRGSNGTALHEFPISTVRLGGVNLPFTGGGYLRHFPLAFARWGIGRVNGEGLPAILYIHPWEIDPGQPRVPGLARTHSFRHYVGLRTAERRFRSLLGDFAWTTVADVLAQRAEPKADNS